MKLDVLKNKIKELKAYCDVPVAECCAEKSCCDCEYDIKYLRSEVQYLYKYLSDLERSFYEHRSSGHLPVIPGAGKMQEILEILKLDGDYEVEKKEIFASSGKKEAVTFTLTAKQD
jgi:hypothetical protein